MRRPLVVVAVFAVLVSACGGGGDDGDAARPSSTTTTAAEVQAGEDATTSTAPSTRSGGTSAPSAAPASDPSPSEPPPPEVPAADDRARPAAPGRHVYDVEGTVTFSGSSRPLPDTATLTIHPAEGERQRSVRETDDGEGNGGSSETVLVYAAGGVHLESLKTTTRTAGFSDTREFRPSPPPLLIPTGASAGDHAEFTMTTTDGRITARTTVDVVGTEPVSVAGTVVDALVVDIVSSFSGEFEGTQRTRNWIDPDRSLTVREHSVTEARVGLTEVHSESQSVIRSLTPS